MSRKFCMTAIPGEIERCGDPRVTQFVRGEAGERLMEMRKEHGK